MNKRFSADILKSAGEPVLTGQERIDAELLETVPEDFAKLHGAVPVYRKGGAIVMALEEGATPDVLEYVKFRSGNGVDFVRVSSSVLRKLIDKNYGADTEDIFRPDGAFSEDTISRIVDEAALASRNGYLSGAASDFSQSSPVVKLSNSIIEEAFFKRASDIHLEPYE